MENQSRITNMNNTQSGGVNLSDDDIFTNLLITEKYVSGATKCLTTTHSAVHV